MKTASTTLRGRFQHHRGAVGDDLAHGLADLRRIEAHHDHRVRAHRLRIGGQAVNCVPARFLEHLRVFVDFAADEGPQPGHHVSANAAAAHDHAEDLAFGFPDAMAGNTLGGDDDHGIFPSAALSAGSWTTAAAIPCTTTPA